MFCKNNLQQISFTDPTNNMPKYLKDILDKSWANAFQKYTFPNINEDRFSVLYSDNFATRPNTPVNVIVGLLILKEIFHLTDEELIGSLYFDVRFQFALRTASYEKQPVSINTLTNFRNRLVEYEKKTGIDLIKLEVENQAEIIAKHLKVENKKVRMDSLMVSSSCKKLSRIELIYSVNAKFVKMLNSISTELIPKECAAYLENGHKNDTIYRTRDILVESKTVMLLNQSQILYQAGLKSSEAIINSEEFKLLSRLLNEQTTEDESGSAVPKLGSKISPESLQNPSDPDATYRKKYGSNTGYVANIVETFNAENSVISSYDFKPNTYSDSKFADDTIEKLTAKITDPKGKIKVITDGSYYEQEKAEAASTKGIDLIPGELVGRKPIKGKMSYSTFAIDPNKNIVTKCAYGKVPIESYFESKAYTAKFNIDDCKNCPHSANCTIKRQKKYNVVRFSEKRYKVDLQREKMGTAEYIKLTNQRAGIEGIPSVLRRKYNVDAMPIRGLLRSKMWFGFKIAAYNFKKLLKQYLKLSGNLICNLIFKLINIFCNKNNMLLQV
jgi:hypothetical protein